MIYTRNFRLLISADKPRVFALRNNFQGFVSFLASTGRNAVDPGGQIDPSPFFLGIMISVKNQPFDVQSQKLQAWIVFGHFLRKYCTHFIE